MTNFQPITFRFDEQKATAVAALFAECAGPSGQTINYMKLLKLMYILERKAITRWGQPVIGGRYVSLDHGPVLSEVYSLILGKGQKSESVWAKYLELPEDFKVSVKQHPPHDCLSQAEVMLVNEVISEYGHYTEWELSKFSHEFFPEWNDPNGSSIPIFYESILKAVEKTPEQILEVRKDAQEVNLLQSIFEGK